MPPIVWGLAAVAALVLVALCVLTGYFVLRARTRARIGQMRVTAIVVLVVSATIPWLVVWLAPIEISMNVRTIPVLIGWILLALLAFALLVLLPIAATLTAVVWWFAWRRRRATATAT